LKKPPVTPEEARTAIEGAISERGELLEKWRDDIASRPSDANGARAARDMLLHAALLGLIDGDAAERLALELCGAPLRNIPSLDAFDARLDADWSLSMAIAWIASKDWQEVTRQKADFRKDAEYWSCVARGLPKDGNPNGIFIPESWTIETLDAPSISGLIIEDGWPDDDDGRMTAAHAKPNLWRALQDGALAATGRRDGGSRETIPATLWQDLETIQDRLDGPEHLRESMHGPRWVGVTVRRDDVLRIWPAELFSPQASDIVRPAEPVLHDRLPLAQWLPLEVALHFVQDGWALHPSNMTLGELELPVSPDGSFRRKGSLLAHQPAQATYYDDPAIHAFNRALTRAGLEERVRFRGVAVGKPVTEIQDIPSGYFTATRIFGPIPVSNPPISGSDGRGQRQEHWHNVTVERDGLLRWLQNEYPAIAALNNDYMPLRQAWAADTIRDFVTAAEGPLGRNPGPISIPTAAAWLAWNGKHPPSDMLEMDLVAAWKEAAQRLMDRIAIGHMIAHGSRDHRTPEPLEARWFRSVHLFFEADGTVLPFSHAFGERGAWFDLQSSTLRLGRSEPEPWQEAMFENVTLDADAVLTLERSPIGGRAKLDAGQDSATPAARMIRRILKTRWPNGEWRDLPTKDLMNRINEVAQKEGRRPFGVATIRRVRKALP
jgi:hypothetical protein